MKILRNILISLIVLLIAAFIIGCNATTETDTSSSDESTDTAYNEELGSIIGTWETSGSIAQIEGTNTSSDMDGNYTETIIFEENNTYVLTLKQDSDGTEETDSELTITGEYSIDGEELTMNVNLVNNMTQDEMKNSNGNDESISDLYNNEVFNYRINSDTLTLINDEEGIHIAFTKIG